MECQHCGHGNPEGARYCNACGMRVEGAGHDGARKCAACGKRMNYDVYFNVCQHCGFTYRISISKPNGTRAPTRLSYLLMYYASLAVPGAGLVIGGTYIPTNREERRLRLDCAVLGAANLVVLGLIAYYLSAWT